MANLIVIVILLIIVGSAVYYIQKEKKRGTRCIGCPSAGCCSKNGCGTVVKKNKAYPKKN